MSWQVRFAGPAQVNSSGTRRASNFFCEDLVLTFSEPSSESTVHSLRSFTAGGAPASKKIASRAVAFTNERMVLCDARRRSTPISAAVRGCCETAGPPKARPPPRPFSPLNTPHGTWRYNATSGSPRAAAGQVFAASRRSGPARRSTPPLHTTGRGSYSCWGRYDAASPFHPSGPAQPLCTRPRGERAAGAGQPSLHRACRRRGTGERRSP